MHSLQLFSADDTLFDTAMKLYSTSFPPHEQRTIPSHRAVLSCPDYHFDLLYDEDLFVGIMFYWETTDYIYVEHFCIDTALRGKRYGQQALTLLHEKGKTVILEIDPPVDAQSIRRKGFYERVGYCANPFGHIHPPYHPENGGHALVVMSYPAPLSQELYDRFFDYVTTRVMG